MNALREELDGQFEVLAVPCNQFGLQEPATNEELLNGLKYVRPGNDYVPNFIVTEKGDVNGPEAHPLYEFLKSSCPPVKEEIGDPSKFYWSPIKNRDITWNFNKFLIRPDGTPYKRYDSEVEPPAIQEDIMVVLREYKAEIGNTVREQFKRLYSEFENKVYNSE